MAAAFIRPHGCGEINDEIINQPELKNIDLHQIQKSESNKREYVKSIEKLQKDERRKHLGRYAEIT